MKETNIKMFEANVKMTETESSDKDFQEDITQMFQHAMVNVFETSKKQKWNYRTEKYNN